MTAPARAPHGASGPADARVRAHKLVSDWSDSPDRNSVYAGSGCLVDRIAAALNVPVRIDDALLHELYEAAFALGTYDDFYGDICDHCAPPEPAAYIAARERLADAISNVKYAQEIAQEALLPPLPSEGAGA